MNRLSICCIAGLAVALTACNQKSAAPTAPGAHAALCADPATVKEIKKIVFDNAAKQAVGDNLLALPDLAKQTTAALDVNVLDSFNADTKKTSCTGQFHLMLPQGVVAGVGGAQDLTAQIRYTVQPAADASGTVYSVMGADDLIQGLASANFSQGATHLQPIAPPLPPGPEAAALKKDVKPNPSAVQKATPGPAANPSRAANPGAAVNSDAYRCAHGDPQSDATIQACDRKDMAGERGDP
jgi:hypothetical protein